MGFDALAWLFVAAVAVHNLEEAIWLPAWSRRAGKWHQAVAPSEFRFAVVVLTALAAGAAGLATTQGKQSVGAYLLSGYALAMLLNVIFPHLLASFVMRRYMPGTLTAFALNLPVTAALLHAAVGESYVEMRRFLFVGPVVVIAIVAMIPLLFWLGRKSRL